MPVRGSMRCAYELQAGVAIEIWTMSGGILFDNILVSHDETAALAFGKKVRDCAAQTVL